MQHHVVRYELVGVYVMSPKTTKVLGYVLFGFVLVVGVVLLSQAFQAEQARQQAIAEERRRARAEALAKAVDKAAIHASERKAEIDAEVQACKDKGGVPVTTLFLGRLKRCDFPGKK